MKRDPSQGPLSIPGFMFSGISSGIKKSGAKDLALLYSHTPAVTAGVFTTNRIKAAPVKLAIRQITSHRAQAIIVNSGNANACTGQKGLRIAREIHKLTAAELGISPELVYLSSTGIIGKQLPLGTFKKAIPSLVKELSPASLHQAAESIMTTDSFKKISSRRIKIGDKTGTIAAIAKGAGMICPDMATMLCFIVTDISLRPQALDHALREAVRRSFNMLSVDNDMSTNDTVMILANGTLENRAITKRSPHFNTFQDALNEITCDLARMIARDGEGATKLVEVVVIGSRSASGAQKIASSVAQSLLVKTALYGRDPNWGRIMAAVGYAGVEVNEEKIDISLNGIKVVSRGLGTGAEGPARKTLARKNITITVDLKMGRETARAITCDLTETYIKINSHYST